MFDDAFEEFALDPQQDGVGDSVTHNQHQHRGASINSSSTTTTTHNQQAQQLLPPTQSDTTHTIEYLANLVTPDETAFQLLKRGLGKPIHSALDRLFGTEQQPHRGLRPGDIVEIFGPKGTGKTQLLLSLAAQCVLPRRISIYNEPQQQPDK